MLTIVSAKQKENVKTPEIAWRNPSPVCHHPKRRNFEREGERARYILQEFVMDGQIGYWTTISNLEVVAGGRAA